jgi:ATP-dependent Clp protease ATP-binding subunit ClpX
MIAPIIEEIANEAIRQKTGARGLRTIVERMLMDVMLEIPDLEEKKSFTVTKEFVLKNEKIKDISELFLPVNED